MKKKRLMSILCLCFAIVFIVPCFWLLTACKGNDDNDQKNNDQPKDNTVNVSQASVVMAEVAEKFDNFRAELTNVANSTEEIVEKSVVDAIVESISETTETNDAIVQDTEETTITQWEKEGIGFYFSQNEWPMGFVYSIDFVVRNATVTNGYSNGFQYGQVYSGRTQIEDFNGYASLLITTDVNNNKVKVFVDFDSDDNQVSYVIDICIDYDFASDTAKKVTVVYAESKYFTDVCYTQYDFESNHFEKLMISAYSDVAKSSRVSHSQEFLKAYNEGTLDLNKIIEYGANYIVMIDGNITDDVNNLNSYNYSAWNYDPAITSLDTSGWYGTVYRSLYSDAKEFKLRTTKLDTSNSKIATYIQDAVNYGFAKSSFSYNIINGKEVYIYPFVEYADMVKYLADIKTTIDKDQNANSYIKEMIASAYSYISSRGEMRYTMKLGTYNGLELELSVRLNYNPYTCFYVIYSKAYSSAIVFEKKNNSNVEVHYATLTNKDIIEELSVEGRSLSDAEQALKNRLESYGEDDCFISSSEYELLICDVYTWNSEIEINFQIHSSDDIYISKAV